MKDIYVVVVHPLVMGPDITPLTLRYSVGDCELEIQQSDELSHAFYEEETAITISAVSPSTALPEINTVQWVFKSTVEDNVDISTLTLEFTDGSVFLMNEEEDEVCMLDNEDVSYVTYRTPDSSYLIQQIVYA